MKNVQKSWKNENFESTCKKCQNEGKFSFTFF